MQDNVTPFRAVDRKEPDPKGLDFLTRLSVHGLGYVFARGPEVFPVLHSRDGPRFLLPGNKR